jgi:hypothetical protein
VQNRGIGHPPSLTELPVLTMQGLAEYNSAVFPDLIHEIIHTPESYSGKIFR